MQTRAALAATFGLPRRLGGQLLETAGQILFDSVRRHRTFMAVVLGYWAACDATGWLTGGSALIDARPYHFLFDFLVVGLAAAVTLGSVVYAMIFCRSEGSLGAAIGDVLFRRVLSANRLATLIVPIVFGPLFFASYSSFKRLIPLVNPYSWDYDLMTWDAWLHGGSQPWTLIQPVLGTPAITGLINLFYNFWLVLMLATFLWQACTLRRQSLRMQYLLSFLFCWIVIGTVLAALFSSAGPCYYGRITGLDDPYRPLMAYLRAAADEAPVWALSTQDMLWANYVNRGTMLGSGISAMPSMHLAIATLMALLGWRINRWLGIGYTAFAAIILVGSVHLAWHYAIDGYVSIVAAIAVWHATGWAMRRRPGVEARR